ncbi:MAG TPA: sigma factor [Planctomycetota bacterium]|nr:sigma factor [Planctomycetota bacterium]
MRRAPANPQSLLAHADFVRTLARTLVRDAAEADDIVQETWRATLEHPPRNAESPRPWLATVVRNFARRFARAENRRERWERAAARRRDGAIPPTPASGYPRGRP